jgi:hypothetical protein
MLVFSLSKDTIDMKQSQAAGLKFYFLNNCFEESVTLRLDKKKIFYPHLLCTYAYVYMRCVS